MLLLFHSTYITTYLFDLLSRTNENRNNMEVSIGKIVEAKLNHKSLSASAVTHVFLEFYQSLDKLGSHADISTRLPQALAIFEFVLTRALEQQHSELRQCEDIIAEGLAAPTDFVSQMSQTKCHLEAHGKFVAGDALYVALWMVYLVALPMEQRTAVETELPTSLTKHGFPTQKKLRLSVEVFQEADTVNFALFDSIRPESQLYFVIVAIVLLWRIQESQTEAQGLIPLVLDADGLLEQAWAKQLPNTHSIDTRGGRWTTPTVEAKLKLSAESGVVSVVKVDSNSTGIACPSSEAQPGGGKKLYLMEHAAQSLESGMGKAASQVAVAQPSWFTPQQFLIFRLEMVAMPTPERTHLALHSVLPIVEPRLVSEIKKFRYSLAKAEQGIVTQRKHLAMLACTKSNESPTTSAGQNSAGQAFKQQQTLIHRLESMVQQLEKQADRAVHSIDLWAPLADLAVDLWQIESHRLESTTGIHLNFSTFVAQVVTPSLTTFLVRNRHHVLKPHGKDSLKRKAFWAMTSQQHGKKTAAGPAGGSDTSSATGGMSEDQWLLLQVCDSLAQDWLKGGPVVSKLASLLDAAADKRIVPDVLRYLCCEDAIDSGSTVSSSGSPSGGTPIAMPPALDANQLQEQGTRTLVLLRAMTSLLEDATVAELEADFPKHVDWCKRAGEMKARLESGAIQKDVDGIKCQWALAAARDDDCLSKAIETSIELSAALGHVSKVLALGVPAKKLELQLRSHTTVQQRAATLNSSALEMFVDLNAQSDPNVLLQASSKVKQLQAEAKTLDQTSVDLGLQVSQGASGVDHGVLGLLASLVMGQS